MPTPTPFPSVFLQTMKELNDAGLIDAAAALGTFLAVVVALLPMIFRWWRRPKLKLEIPPDHYRTSTTKSVEGTAAIETVLFAGVPGQAPPQAPDKLFCSAVLVIRNKGISAAVSTRVVATDLYLVNRIGRPLVWKDFSQRQITGVEELPGGLTARFVLLSRVQVGFQDSRYCIGRLVTATVQTVNSSRTVSFNCERDIEAHGTYVVRLIVSASNSRARTHLLVLKISPDDTVKLTLAGRAMVRKVRREDRERARPEVSAGG